MADSNSLDSTKCRPSNSLSLLLPSIGSTKIYKLTPGIVRFCRPLEIGLMGLANTIAARETDDVLHQPLFSLEIRTFF